MGEIIACLREGKLLSGVPPAIESMGQFAISAVRREHHKLLSPLNYLEQCAAFYEIALFAEPILAPPPSGLSSKPHQGRKERCAMN
ncbi:MAG TPA: hypothetical protein VII48_06040 [Rhizomicrobium sp.]